MAKPEELEKLKDLRLELAGRQQNSASDPKRSVWVEASAGTGKTKVLSDRVLRLFLNGVSPAQILCLTYTKAAAVEMNDRISARLAQWAVMPETKLIEELAPLVETVDKEIINRARTLFAITLDIPSGIKIQTIHSFCQEILKRFPMEAGIPPYFDIMDERMSREILAAVSREMILKIDEGKSFALSQSIAFLTEHIKEFKFSELMNTLAENRAKILAVLSAYPSLDAFLQKLQEKLNLSVLSEEDARKNFIAKLEPHQFRQLAAVLRQSTPTDNKTGEILASLADAWPEEFDYDKYKKIFITDGKKRARLVCKAAEKIMPEMQCLAEEILIFEDYLSRLKLYDSTKAIISVAGELADGYAAYKRRNARLDYEDLIALTRRLLENKDVADWILYKLDSSINHILIDEAQDTSPDQWAIIRALSDDFFAGFGQNEQNRTVFAVGDRKQSIYSFQGANPEEFDSMRNYFSQKTEAFSKIRLDVSFRSTEAVLQMVNKLFDSPDAQSGVVIDNEKVNHLPFRVGQYGKVEIWPLIETSEKDNEDVWYPPLERCSSPTASLRLARQIAKKIKKLVEEKTFLRSQNRPICYGDIMVLVQRRNAFVEEFVRECKNIGVQIAGVDKLKLLEQIAVQDLISLGNFLLLPVDDLSLAEVLKSPLFGLDDDDLFKLCHNRPSSLWQNLRSSKEYDSVAQELLELLGKVDFVRPFELFNYVLTTLGGKKKFAARLGAEAEDAIDEFINLTLAYEEEHIPDLQGFMQWIVADKIEVKRELDQSGTDAVRLMTVHGSKGLQAPIVILPDTTRIAKTSKASGLLWDNDHMVYFPLNADSYDQNCERIHEAGVNKAFDEYRRLLYVALTRAEDMLFICGIKSSKNIDERSWYNLCKRTLEQYGVKQDDDVFALTSDQIIEPKANKENKPAPQAITLPDWINRPAKQEAPLSKPYMPSHADEDDDTAAASPLQESGNYFQRGLLIHRILQLLEAPSDKESIQEFVRAYLQTYASQISQDFRRNIEEEIMRLYETPQFGFIFGEDSYAEVPIAGETDGRLVSAQIDRLYLGKDKIMIVDFKTNRPAAKNVQDVPPAYIKQLAVYKSLVEKIYPSRKIETYILWTNVANLMRID